MVFRTREHSTTMFRCFTTSRPISCQLARKISKFLATNGRFFTTSFSLSIARCQSGSTPERRIYATAILSCFHPCSWRNCVISRLEAISPCWVEINEATAAKSSPSRVTPVHPLPGVPQHIVDLLMGGVVQPSGGRMQQAAKQTHCKSLVVYLLNAARAAAVDCKIYPQ